MGKLEGKVAVITGGSSGMALESAKRFVEEGAYVFITGRRQEALDEAVKLIGRNVSGVRGDASNPSMTSTVCSTQSSGKRARSTFCLRALARVKPYHWAGILPSSTSMRPFGAFDCARNAVYGSEGVAAAQRWRIDHHDRVRCFGKRFSWFQRLCGEQGGIALLRTHVAQRTERSEYPGERAEPGAGRHRCRTSDSTRRRRRCSDP